MAFLGAGSNLLVADSGYRGVVVSLADLPSEAAVEEDRIRVGAGARLPVLVNRLTRLGLSGLEWAEGIPGTVGGSMRMNAGAFKDSMQSSVREVTLLDRHGRVERRAVGAADFDYRAAPFVGERAVVEAVLQLARRAPERSRGSCSPIREHRRRTQPQGVRSSGMRLRRTPPAPTPAA